ncbi:MAG TPA: hypothetical protein VLJ21_01610 [Candidatus Binatia bacterium]|nr:hypothetical protein [Candidatus Binatia bacterium]
MRAVFYHSQDPTLETRLGAQLVMHAMECRNQAYEIYASTSSSERLEVDNKTYEGVSNIIRFLSNGRKKNGKCDATQRMLQRMRENSPVSDELREDALNHILSACKCYTKIVR